MGLNLPWSSPLMVRPPWCAHRRAAGFMSAFGGTAEITGPAPLIVAAAFDLKPTYVGLKSRSAAVAAAPVHGRLSVSMRSGKQPYYFTRREDGRSRSPDCGMIGATG